MNLQGGLPSFPLQLKCEHVKCMVTVALWGPDVTVEPSLQSCPPEEPLLVPGMFSCNANAWASVVCSQVCSVVITTTFPRCVSLGSPSHVQGDTACCTPVGRGSCGFPGRFLRLMACIFVLWELFCLIGTCFCPMLSASQEGGCSCSVLSL